MRHKTLRELELIRATILGRAGMVFLDRWGREYMAQADWYQPGTYDATRLSAVDVRNLRTVAAYKAALPRSELSRSCRRASAPSGRATRRRENILRIKRRERELGGSIGDAALQAALSSDRK